MNTPSKLEQLRHWMQENGSDAIFISGLDPHQSESVANHWKAMQWLTGFTGSFGYAVVTATQAAFWTDGRYTEQAAREVKDPGFELLSISDPTHPSWHAWLAQRIQDGATLTLDGSVLSIAGYRANLRALESRKVSIKMNLGEFLDTHWTDRPVIPTEPLYELESAYTCRSRAEKLSLVREALPKDAAEHYVLETCLEDVVWLTNLRGHDNPLYPFYHAYAVVSETNAWLFTDASKIPADRLEALNNEGFTVRPYGEVNAFLGSLPAGSVVILDAQKTGASLFWAIPKHCRCIERQSLVNDIKSHKSPAEQENVRLANRHECAAVVRLMRWIEENAADGELDEYKVGQQLNTFRSLSPLYLQPANIPIVGYAANAALPHYRPSATKAERVLPRGFLLFDVCAQYKCGTTDLTRTVAVGELTDEMRRDYTTVLKAHIRLATQKFPQGTTGNLLDAVVKSGMWNRMENFRHGTGHGIGYVSNVHEGPGKICIEFASAFPYAWNTPLEEGMLFSNEPGLYKPGRHGIRIENSVFVQDCGKNEFGRFFEFETVTFLPFEHRAICTEMLTQEETDWIRAYYVKVRAALRPLLSDEEYVWLEQKTDF